jgi:hypothetical protein
MNCRQYRRELSDWATDRLSPAKHAAMVAHRAACPGCARYQQEEENFLATWREIPEVTPPDISLRLHSRINSSTPALRVRRIGSIGYFAAASVAVCAMGYFSWMQINEGITRDTAAKSVALLPAEQLPLAEMLTEVRWRSSDERNLSDEPPSYNEETRALLLPPQNGNAK